MKPAAVSVAGAFVPGAPLYKGPIGLNRHKHQAPVSSFVPRGRTLFWQDDQQAQKIEVIDGVLRAVRLLENGNRQIVAFFWPGDTVMPSYGACQHFTVEAVTNCRVRLSSSTSFCHNDQPCGARQVLAETLSLVASMSQKSATARVAWFLLRAQKHLPADPTRPFALRLVVPRADIADYVGTSLETVCRTLAEFKGRKLIDLPNRKTIQYLNVVGLSQVSGD